MSKPGHNLEVIQQKLNQFSGKNLPAEQRVKEAISLAELILAAANKIQSPYEIKLQKKLSRMVEDPLGKMFTSAMTDECFRSSNHRRIANQIVYLLKSYGIPKFLDDLSKMNLWLFKNIGEPLSFFLIPLVKRMIRQETSRVILPGEEEVLEKHIRLRKQGGVTTNLNRLGEAILGENEALTKLKIYCEDLANKNVEYISVKISTLTSQINLIGWEETLKVLQERLRILYRTAIKNSYTDKEGRKVAKFVNLDMEEYRDLQLTLALFRSVLDEEEFLHFRGGIVLQAYLPDSYQLLVELTDWAKSRVARGGSPIKVRLVKGANLAMEKVDASLHGWQQTPFMTKIEVDANYRKMVNFATKPENACVVNLGIASHNLFDLAYSLIILQERDVHKFVNFEMLEGMAEHLREVIISLSDGMTLYCPAASQENFQNAIAYLIRRLDENTSSDNFLRHTFNLTPSSESFKNQAIFFRDGCALIPQISEKPNRKQNRLAEPVHLAKEAPFQNEADTDFSLSHNREWVRKIFQEYQTFTPEKVPLSINGEIFITENQLDGISPNTAEVFYSSSLANLEQVDMALQCAINEVKNWQTADIENRSEILRKSAVILRQKRGELIKIMMMECGKHFEEADVEISEAIDFCEYYSRSMLELSQIKGFHYSPTGVVLVASPWNFPLAIPLGGVAAALVTGNVVILKPAPEAILTGWQIAKIFYEAGMDKKYLQFIACQDDPEGSFLVSDPRLNGCILTGATATAQLFLQMNPSLNLMAETGGKNSIIVSDLSDRDLAIKDIISSAFGHAGQKCSACSLLILEKNVYEDKNFLHALKDAAESLKVAPSHDPASKVNPLIRPAQGKLLQALTNLAEGESWLLEPQQDANNRHLWSPGIKMGVKPGSFSFETEFFGPVLAVVKAENLADAVRIANLTEYGLTGGIHTLDQREKDYWLSHIKIGNAYLNRPITGAIVRRQPFGGVKASNFGRGFKAGGADYLLQLVKIREDLKIEKVNQSLVNQEFNELLNHLNDEEKEIFLFSVKDYELTNKNYFQAKSDPSQVVGQANYTLYQAVDKVILFIQEEDKKIDIFRVIAAAKICGTPLEIIGPEKIFNEYKLEMLKVSGVSCRVCSPSKVFVEINPKEIVKIRILGNVPEEWRKIATEKLLFLATIPVYSVGRFELLHYFRATSVSDNYHRYGNCDKKKSE